MSNLEDFLQLNDVSEIRETVIEKINGKDFEFVIRPLTSTEHLDFQRRSQIFNKKSINFDTGKYQSLVLSNCIVEPDFNKVDFLEKVKCNTANEFLQKKIPAGILSDLAEKVQKLSGFEPFELEIEQAKN